LVATCSRSIRKGRRLHHGSDAGYQDSPPAALRLPPGNFYNKYFPATASRCRPPLSDQRVEYTDGAPMTVEQYSKDISAFLM